LKIQDHHLVIDTTKTRTITVALLALHVVFTVENHPEFVWSTFEHVDSSSGEPNLAPSAPSNPTSTPGDEVISNRNFLLYKAGTKASEANLLLVTDQTVDPPFDEATQTFKMAGKAVQTSIYRAFPASKSTDASIDDDIKDLNSSVGMLFGPKSRDIRTNYRLVGGVWLKQGRKAFTLNTVFDDGKSTDDPSSLLQGEDRLSSMGMESFTQTSFQHCFMCHNTTPVTDDLGNQIISEKLLNVSHVLSRFLASQP
jgi:hypothetical protein